MVIVIVVKILRILFEILIGDGGGVCNGDADDNCDDAGDGVDKSILLIKLQS